MLGPLWRFLDWTAIQLAAARMPSTEGVDPHLEEAVRLVNDKDFLSTAPPAPKVDFAGARGFSFPSPLSSPYEVNNLVHGQFYRSGPEWQKKPAVILVHGWNDVTSHFLLFPLLAGKMEQAGLNALTLELPYHFQRRPRSQLGRASNFLSADILRVGQAAAQAVAEIRAATRWLKAQGCPRVGLLGVSLGGWFGGLAACHEPQLDALALVVPATRLDQMIEEVAFCQSIRATLQGRKIDLGRLNLLASAPLMPKENVLLVEAEHDRFIPRGSVEELRAHWGGPELWHLSTGHVSSLWTRGLLARLVIWFGQKLDGRAAK